MLIVATHIDIPYGDFATDGQQTRLENHELPTGRLYEMGESPRQAALGVVEESVYGAHKRVTPVEQPCLIGFPTVHWSRHLHLAYRHDGDFLVPGGIGRIALVVEPIATDDADGVRRAFNIIYHILAVVGGKDVGAVDGFSSKDGVNAEVHGT